MSLRGVRFTLALFAVLIICLAPLAPGRGLPHAAAEPVLLGINYPLTGPYSVEGLDQIRAARLAVDEINHLGGILGRRIELLTRDSASDVLITRLNVTQLIDAGCGMIFGGSSSAVAMAAADICQQRGVLFFGTLTYSMETTIRHGHRHAFRECNDTWMAARLMADWLQEHHPDARYFFITADYTWGWSTEQSLREVVGLLDAQQHPRVLTPLGATDFTAALQQAEAAEPQVLVLVLFGKDMAHALRQAEAMGLKRRLRIVVPSLTLGMAERTGAKAMEDVVGTTPWTWKVPQLFNHPRGQAFVADFEKRYRRYPSTSGASAYSIIHQYKDAVERAGSFAAADVIRALEGHSYALLKDTQTWRALDHQNIQTVYLVRGSSPETVLADSRRQDYFEIIGYKPGEELALTPGQWRVRRQVEGLPPQLEALPDEGGTP